MDPYLHTALALLTIYIAWRVGRVQRRKEDIERYTQHLEEQGFVHIQKIGENYEFIKHWKNREAEDNA
jgi:uncharacterized protein YcgL (UPF0745 family)